MKRGWIAGLEWDWTIIFLCIFLNKSRWINLTFGFFDLDLILCFWGMLDARREHFRLQHVCLRGTISLAGLVLLCIDPEEFTLKLGYRFSDFLALSCKAFLVLKWGLTRLYVIIRHDRTKLHAVVPLSFVGLALVDEGLFIIFEFLFLNFVYLVFTEVNRFLFFLPSLLDVVYLFLLLVNQYAVLIGILGHDFFNPWVSRNVYYSLALTVLDVNKRAVSKQQDLANLEKPRLCSNMQGTSPIYLLTKLNFGSRVLQKQVDDFEHAGLSCDFQRRPVINARSVRVNSLHI